MNNTELEFYRCLEMHVPLKGKLSEEKCMLLLKDYLSAKQKHLAEPMDYLKYKFYNMNEEQRTKFLTRQGYAALCEEYNDRRRSVHIAEKTLFIEKYRAFLGRDAIIASRKSKDIFENMCGKYKRLMLKPNNGGYGKGIHIFDTSTDREEVWAQAIEGHCILEEVIEQYETLALFHRESVNTVRILTIVSQEKEPIIIAAAFRCGRGKSVTDNAGGLYAAIDRKSGIVTTDGMSPFCEIFRYHPDSNITFRGFQIPHWNRLIGRVMEVAMVMPEVRIVNWDWALRKDGEWILIEGNLYGGIGPLQAASGKGLRFEVMNPSRLK